MWNPSERVNENKTERYPHIYQRTHTGMYQVHVTIRVAYRNYPEKVRCDIAMISEPREIR